MKRKAQLTNFVEHGYYTERKDGEKEKKHENCVSPRVSCFVFSM